MVGLCVCELLKQTHMSRANVPRVKAICKYVCVHLPGVSGGQEDQPFGKHHFERSRGRLMVTASAALAATNRTHTPTLFRVEKLKAFQMSSKKHLLSGKEFHNKTHGVGVNLTNIKSNIP